MELVLALILGAIIMCMKLKDKADNKSFKKIIKEDHDKAYEFSNKYQIEYSALEQYKSKVASNDTDVINMRKRIESECGIIPTDNMVILGLTAQQSKLPTFGVSTGGFESPAGSENRSYSRLLRIFLEWYDKELRTHGFPYELYFVSYEHDNDGWSRDLSSYGVPVSQCTECPPYGRYVWEPIKNSSLSFEGIL